MTSKYDVVLIDQTFQHIKDTFSVNMMETLHARLEVLLYQFDHENQAGSL